MVLAPKNKRRLWKTHKTPLSAKWAFMVLGSAFMVFSGVIVLVYLREVGFALSLYCCVGVVGVCVG